METDLVIARRYPDRIQAELARQRLVEAALPCEVTSIRTNKYGLPAEFGLLVDRHQLSRVDELLGPEPLPNVVALRQGSRSLRMALGLLVLSAVIVLALSLMTK